MENIFDTSGFIINQVIRTDALRITGYNVGHCWYVNLLNRHKNEFRILKTKARDESRIKIEESRIVFFQDLI